MNHLLRLLRSYGVMGAFVLLILGYMLWQRLPDYWSDQKLIGSRVADFTWIETSRVLPQNSAEADGSLQLRLTDFQAKKLLLYFFATWCGFCERQVPSLQKIQRRLPSKDFRILAISLEDLEQLQYFQKRHQIDYTILRDENQGMHEQFQIQSYPTLVWLTADGRVKKIQRGLNLLLPYTVSYWVTGNPFYDKAP